MSFCFFAPPFHEKMPPKKEEPVKKVLLGRPGNNVKMGVVGTSEE